MLGRFTDYLIALLELLEAQAKSLGAGLVAAGTNLAVAVAGVVLASLGLLALVLAVYLSLAPLWGPAGATAASAALLLLLGGGLVWLAGQRSQRT